jgi:SAM-dependent methyltransferase
MAKLANFVLNLKGKEAAVLEIGSNDGLFLRSMTDIGLTNICGVDPAENIASKANEDGLTTVIGFWPEAGEEFSSLSFDVVIGQNVFAHTSDPLESLLEVKRVLSANGYAIFQTSQADMIANGELDTIYHEHCSFFVESSMSALAQRAGLQLAYTHYVDIHGASSLYILTHDYTEPDNLSIELSAIASGLIGVEPKNDKEARLRKYRTKKDWDTFHKIATIKSAGALTVAESWMEDGYRIVAVGAAAKAITFLRASGLPVDAFLDESDLKIGKWVPGLDVQITDFKSIEENDAYIIGAWNFAREIAMKLINQGADPAAPCMLYFPEGVTTNLGYLAVKGIDEL